MTTRLFEVLLALAVWYAFIREAVAIMQRVRYNKTHRYKVFLVNIYDIPYYMIEFFLLPYIAVRWLKKHFLNTTKTK